MNLKYYYKYLLLLKKQKKDINIEDKQRYKRFKYFINTPNIYDEYNFEEVIYNKFGAGQSKRKFLLVNFDYCDFIQSYFFRNEIIRYCNIESYILDSLSVYPYKSLKAELKYLMEDQVLKFGQEWLFPVDNNKWKNILNELVKQNVYDLIIFNGINYYFYYFLTLFPDYKDKIVIYDPHLLVGKEDFRDITADKIPRLEKFDINIIADSDAKEYKKGGMKFKKFISHKHALPLYLKNYFKKNNEFLKQIFVGGDTNRDIKSLYEIIKKFPNINFNVCSSQKLDFQSNNLVFHGYVNFYKFLEICNFCDASLIILANKKPYAGLITTTISFLLSKPVFINNNLKNRQYIKNGYNGFLFNDPEHLNGLFEMISNDTEKVKKISENSYNSFLREHQLENLVKSIFVK